MSEDSEDQVTYKTIVEHFSSNSRVSFGKWVRKPCLMVDRKAFLVFFNRDVALKLNEKGIIETSEIEGAHLFDPHGRGDPFRQWIQIPVAQSSKWIELAEKAYEFVESLG